MARGVVCKKCGCRDTKVVDSRKSTFSCGKRKGYFLRRKAYCRICDRVFTDVVTIWEDLEDDDAGAAGSSGVVDEFGRPV